MTPDFIAKEAARRFAPRNVGVQFGLAQKVAHRFGFTVSDLRSDSREADLVRARHAAIVALYRAGHTKNSIGRFLRRDHSSVIYALKKAGVA